VEDAVANRLLRDAAVDLGHLRSLLAS
jgi:hypothetical protein